MSRHWVSGMSFGHAGNWWDTLCPTLSSFINSRGSVFPSTTHGDTGIILPFLCYPRMQKTGRLSKPHLSGHIYSHFFSRSYHFLKTLQENMTQAPLLPPLWVSIIYLAVFPALSLWYRIHCSLGPTYPHPETVSLKLYFPPARWIYFLVCIVGKLSHCVFLWYWFGSCSIYICSSARSI